MPSLRKKEAYERSVLERDFAQEVQDFEMGDWNRQAGATKRAAPDPSEIIAVRKKYGMDISQGMRDYISSRGSVSGRPGTMSFRRGESPIYDRFGNVSGIKRNAIQYNDERDKPYLLGTNRATGAGEVDTKLKGQGMTGPVASNQVAGVTGSRGRPSTESAAPTASIRGMFTPGAGSTNGLSLRAEGSLFDNPIFAANRAIEKGFNKPTGKSDYSMPQTFTSKQYNQNTATGPDYDPSSEPGRVTPGSRLDKFFAETDTLEPVGGIELNEGTDMQAYDALNRATYGGDVADPMEFLSMALRDGLGDEKLIQAAMKGGDSYGRKYKNLNRMGVV
jgi:hypothetical protein